VANVSPRQCSSAFDLFAGPGAHMPETCGTRAGRRHSGRLAKTLLDRNSTHDMIFRILVASVPAARRAVQIVRHLSLHDFSSDAICIPIIRKN